MQLNNMNVRQALALATCALVHGTAAHSAEGDWKVSGAYLHYEEVDRVTVSAPTLFATKDLGDEDSVTLRAVYDVLTGASPNGAAPGAQTDASGATLPQVFTGASGMTSYSAAVGELPLKGFSDTRIAVGLDWTDRTSSVTGRTLSANVSKEEDYLSLGGSGTWTRDYNNKLTTLALGIGVAVDTVQPSSPAPVGLSSLSSASTTAAQTTTCSSGAGKSGLQTRDDDEDDDDRDGCSSEYEGERKTVLDLMVGMTQVLSRSTLMQLNYTISQSSGYLTDPYKLVSIVNATTGFTEDYAYEKRPDYRLAQSVYWKLVHNFGEDVTHLSYRYFFDDWGIQAHTAELQYRFKVTDWFYVEPQFHYHVQTAADFYRHSVTTAEYQSTSIDYASADMRLADMTATSAGLKLGFHVGDGEISMRYVKLKETGDSHPGDAIGIQKQFDLYPTMEANIVTVGFSTPL